MKYLQHISERSWEQVAAEFTRRTGRPMTPKNAAQCGFVAERKLRSRLAQIPAIRDLLKLRSPQEVHL